METLIDCLPTLGQLALEKHQRKELYKACAERAAAIGFQYQSWLDIVRGSTPAANISVRSHSADFGRLPLELKTQIWSNHMKQSRIITTELSSSAPEGPHTNQARSRTCDLFVVPDQLQVLHRVFNNVDKTTIAITRKELRCPTPIFSWIRNTTRRELNEFLLTTAINKVFIRNLPDNIARFSEQSFKINSCYAEVITSIVLPVHMLRGCEAHNLQTHGSSQEGRQRCLCDLGAERYISHYVEFLKQLPKLKTVYLVVGYDEVNTDQMKGMDGGKLVSAATKLFQGDIESTETIEMWLGYSYGSKNMGHLKEGGITAKIEIVRWVGPTTWRDTKMQTTSN